MATAKNAHASRTETEAREAKKPGEGRSSEQDKSPGQDNSPGRGGYLHADTRMGHQHGESLGEAERLVTGKEKPPKSADTDDLDKPSE